MISYYYIKSKGGENLKKVTMVLKKITPAITACLAFVLTLSANTSTCYFFNQPDPPKGLDEFKRIK